ncbi:hypothetical protein D3C86_1735170 [compost metagenome]
MHQAIILVALPAQRGVQRVIGEGASPLLIRHLGVGEVRAEFVNGEQQQDRQISLPGQAPVSQASRQTEDDDNRHHIFQPPVDGIMWRNAGRNHRRNRRCQHDRRLFRRGRCCESLCSGGRPVQNAV